MSGPPAIVAREVALARGGRRVLAGLSLTLEAGGQIGIMGPNGAGKTSLLRALMGFDPPAGGQLSLLGQTLPCGRRALWDQVGCVFQSASLDGELTVRENLCLGGALFGVGGALGRARGEAAMAAVGLGGVAHTRVKRLSGGTRRRAELARALLHRPRLLLLDEATAGLDPQAARQFWALIEPLRAAGCAVLSATHLPNEAARVDRLLVLAGGRVVADAPPAELLAELGGDVITCEAADAGALVEEVTSRLAVRAWLQEGRLTILSADGHHLVPRLVEALGPRRLASVSLRRPGLADVFFHLTGGDLSAPAAADAARADAGGARAGR